MSSLIWKTGIVFLVSLLLFAAIRNAFENTPDANKVYVVYLQKIHEVT